MCRFILSLFITLILSPNLSAQITWEEHPVPIENTYNYQVDFGYIKVPENRKNPDSRHINVAFTRIKSNAQESQKDAVIYLPGGPGGNFCRYVNGWLRTENVQKVLEKRDVVLLDPRGCGFSYPKLCENLNDHKNYYDLGFLRGNDYEKAMTRIWNECASLLEENNVDVHGYNSVEVANDLEGLRKALGYDQWNIRGHSYGSYYGFVLMQEYPESVRAAFLSGIVPLTWEYNWYATQTLRTIYLVIDSCKKDPLCREQFPDLEDQILQLLKRLETSPIEVQLPDETGELEYTYDVSPYVFLGGMFQLSYNKSGIEAIPALTQAIYNNNSWIVKNIAPLLSSPNQYNNEMLTIIQSNDDDPNLPPRIADKNLEDYKLYNSKWLPNAMDEENQAWTILRTKDSLSQPTWQKLDIPVLMLSGNFDPITPPGGAKYMLNFFNNAEHHVLATKAHDHHMFYFPEFYENPNPKIDVSELMNDKSLNFITDYSVNRGVATLMSKIAMENFSPLWFPGLCLLLAVVSFLFISFNFVYLRIKKKDRPHGHVKLRLWLIALTICVVVGLLSAGIFDALNSNPYLIALGLPKGWSIIKLGYVILGILLIESLIKIKKIWLSKLRILIAMTLLAGFGFMAFIVTNGFV